MIFVLYSCQDSEQSFSVLVIPDNGSAQNTTACSSFSGIFGKCFLRLFHFLTMLFLLYKENCLAVYWDCSINGPSFSVAIWLQSMKREKLISILHFDSLSTHFPESRLTGIKGWVRIWCCNKSLFLFLWLPSSCFFFFILPFSCLCHRNYWDD